MSEKYLHEMIDDIEVLIDESKTARFNPGKVVIDKDVLMTVIEELRKQIPGEIERSHKIILSKESILEDARIKAQNMVNQAAAEAGTLIESNEIVEMAKMRAEEIETNAKNQAREVLKAANEEADQVRIGALQYTKEIMDDIEGYVSSLKDAQQNIFAQMMDALDSDYRSIRENTQEIEQQLGSVSISQAKTRTVEDFLSKED